MAKDLISFPDLTRDLGGFDLLASAARKAEGAQERKDVFKARWNRARSRGLSFE